MSLIVGNWKMNGLLRSSIEEIRKIGQAMQSQPCKAESVICPPAIWALPAFEAMRGTPLLLGGQDCHSKEKGPHTGDISAVMWKAAGAQYVIVGHSERRTDHGETSSVVAAKAAAVAGAGLVPIICIGETEAQKKAGQTKTILREQTIASLDGVKDADFVLAYEPVWAIGSGMVPEPEEISDIHGMLQQVLATETASRIRLLYGGSVNPRNASSILAGKNIDGALIGGASLKADEFLAICRAAPDSQ